MSADSNVFKHSTAEDELLVLMNSEKYFLDIPMCAVTVLLMMPLSLSPCTKLIDAGVCLESVSYSLVQRLTR